MSLSKNYDYGKIVSISSKIMYFRSTFVSFGHWLPISLFFVNHAKFDEFQAKTFLIRPKCVDFISTCKILNRNRQISISENCVNLDQTFFSTQLSRFGPYYSNSDFHANLTPPTSLVHELVVFYTIWAGMKLRKVIMKNKKWASSVTFLDSLIFQTVWNSLKIYIS